MYMEGCKVSMISSCFQGTLSQQITWYSVSFHLSTPSSVILPKPYMQELYLQGLGSPMVCSSLYFVQLCYVCDSLHLL